MNDANVGIYLPDIHYTTAIDVVILFSTLHRTCFFKKPVFIFIEVNQRDYRAWYGLGQIYEILKMPFYCLYYFRRAQMLR